MCVCPRGGAARRAAPARTLASQGVSWYGRRNVVYQFTSSTSLQYVSYASH